MVSKAGYRSLLAVPLLREDRVIGGLVVRRKAAGSFPDAVVDLLQTFADPVGHRHPECAALPGDRREEPGARRALAQPGAALPPLDGAPGAAVLSEQLTRVLDAARQVVGLDHLYIWTLNPAADGFMVTARAGLRGE